MPIKDSIFSDPLEGWNNPDILIDENARADLEAGNPGLFRVLDWEAFRKAFLHHEKLAVQFKRQSKMQGIAAAGLSGLGLALLGGEPFFPTGDRILLGIALILMTGGAAFGILDWLIFTERRKWLAHRYWCERLRQFYFQFLVREHALAAKAIEDDEAYKVLLARREELLGHLYHDRDDPWQRIDALIRDNGNLESWVFAEWDSPLSVNPVTPGLDLLFKALKEQRVDKQLEFASRNLGPDIYSPKLRDKLLQGTATLAVFVTLLFAIFSVIGLFTGTYVLRYSMREWLGLVAVTSAIGVTAKAINDGLRTKADIGRYESYHAALKKVEHDFDNGHAEQKLAAVKQLEWLSYIELRAFMVDQNATQFLV